MFSKINKLFNQYATDLCLNLRVEYDCNIPTHNQKLHDVIYHLVSNSIAHCRVNNLTVKVAVEENLITVIDNGKGINIQSVLSKIDNPPKQVTFDILCQYILQPKITTSVNKDRISGFGMGLNQFPGCEVTIFHVPEGFKISVFNPKGYLSG